MEGERSAVIREYLGLPTTRRHVRLPGAGHLERRQQCPTIGHRTASTCFAMAADSQETALTDGKAQRRTQRIKRATW